MYKVFVVDDEYYARKCMAEFIKGLDNCEIAGQADNGETALEEVLETNPDILITDVKMPKMDGLTLIKKLRENGKDDIKVIFMSAYSDVEFVRAALKVDAVDYILKPINITELTNVINKVTKELDKEKKEREHLFRVEKKLMQSAPYLNKDFFVNLIEGSYENADKIKQRMEFLGIKMPEGSSHCVAIVRFEKYKSIISDMSKRTKKAFDYAVVNVLQEIINEHFSGYSFDVGNGEFIGIVNIPRDCSQYEMRKFKNEIVDILKRTFNTSVKTEIGVPEEHVKDIGKSYKAAYKSIDSNNAQTAEKIKHYIDEHYRENIRIKDIADNLFLTSTYICLIFKNEVGITINKYITQMRIEEAKNLLKNTNMTIAQIALSVGYTDTTYFSKLFKSYTGSNPSEMR